MTFHNPNDKNMVHYYMHKFLPSESQEMLDGARIASFDNPEFIISESDDINGPYTSLKELRTNSILYKNLLESDSKRAEKISLEKFIVKVEKLITFPADYNTDFEKIIYRIMQHSENGSIKGKDVRGIHIYNPRKIKILNMISNPNKLGIFKAEIEVLNERTNNWIKKESTTTFFPNDWDTYRLIHECYFAFVNRKKISETEYIGITELGIKVLFLYSESGEFKTVYPIYE